jgi:hypothetical protein
VVEAASMPHTATLFLLLLVAQPREAERGVLPGLIVDAATVPRDARGQPDEQRIPGARAWQPPDGAVAERRAALDEQRAAAAASAAGAAAVAIPPLAGDAQAPPRLDAGDPDPDRLHSPLPPPQR